MRREGPGGAIVESRERAGCAPVPGLDRGPRVRRAARQVRGAAVTAHPAVPVTPGRPGTLGPGAGMRGAASGVIFAAERGTSCDLR